MKRGRPIRLGNLQLRIMKVLWQRGSARVAEVQDALGPDSGLAYTTIATMLRKMEERGLVSHQNEGRSFVYSAAVAEHDVTGGLADDLLDRVFAGSLADMVSHLLASREISPDELRELEQLIASRKKKP
ncbi:MAG: BlaI/MecI/CopY family transcriptional regulator [Pirellulales bacterium]